ncbi:hypothetical protein [Staphylococcus saprophyticus]|uniref:hypothetical protein n=1 Tax=Staphylococcus saprophyticus TaxID=29385 RepID=UPI0034C6453E
MGKSIKKQLFKQFIQERCNGHIEAVKDNVSSGAITLAEAQSFITYEPIAHSIEQQYNFAKTIGGIKIGQALFIGNQDLKFVTDDYLKQTITEVIEVIDKQTIFQELKTIDEAYYNY